MKITVRNWRRALEVPRTTEGTRKLAVAYTPEKLPDDVRALVPHVVGQGTAERLLEPVEVTLRDAGAQRYPHGGQVPVEPRLDLAPRLGDRGRWAVVVPLDAHHGSSPRRPDHLPGLASREVGRCPFSARRRGIPAVNIPELMPTETFP
jgi:hypothetical protein